MLGLVGHVFVQLVDLSANLFDLIVKALLLWVHGRVSLFKSHGLLVQVGHQGAPEDQHEQTEDHEQQLEYFQIKVFVLVAQSQVIVHFDQLDVRRNYREDCQLVRREFKELVTEYHVHTHRK